MRCTPSLAAIGLWVCLPGIALTGYVWGAAPPARPEQPAAEVSVPLRQFGNKPVVDVKINGKGPFALFFDTGAQGSGLDLALAQELKLPVIGEALIASPGGKGISAKRVRLTVQIGTLIRADGRAVAWDRSRLYPDAKAPRGVLSARMFPGYLVTLDLSKKRLLLRKGELPKPDGATVFACDPKVPIPTIGITVAGLEVKVHLDSGAPRGLTLPLSLAERLPLEAKPVVVGRGKRVDREVVLYRARLRGDIRLGRHVLHNPVVHFDNALSEHGLVGNEILERHALTFDSANNRVRLADAAADAGIDERLTKKVDEYVRPYLDMHDFSGAILIARDGRVMVRKAYGMANFELGVANTPQTKFALASLTKTFTAAAVLHLRSEGRLKLTDPVSRFLPDYPRGDKITIEHLLGHRSGIPDYSKIPGFADTLRKPLSLAAAVDWFKNRPLEFTPGSRSSYSNLGYVLLAHLIEKITGQSYDSYLRRTIFDPLGMKSTGSASHVPLVKDRAAGYTIAASEDGIENVPWFDNSLKTGAGSLLSTVDDLYLWYRAIKDKKFFWNGNRLEAYGWGGRKWFNRTALTQDGAAPGVTAHISAYLFKEDMCLIILSNIDSGALSRMKMDLAALVFGEKYDVPTIRPRLVVRPELLNRYAGRYQFAEDTTFDVLVRGGHLYYRWGSESYPLMPLGDDLFFARDRFAYERLRFVTGTDGKVAHLLFGKDKLCKKIKAL
jgi:CubicO group peptidase (beta-lactamase class C family)